MGDSCGLHIHPRDSQSLTQYSRMPFLFSGQTSMKQFIPSLVASLYSIPVLTKILSGLIPHYSLVPRLRNLAVWDWERDWYQNAETRDTTTHPIKWLAHRRQRTSTLVLKVSLLGAQERTKIDVLRMAHQTGIERETLISLGVQGKYQSMKLQVSYLCALIWKLENRLPLQLSAVKQLFVARCKQQEPFCSQYVVQIMQFEPNTCMTACGARHRDLLCFGKKSKSVVRALYTSISYDTKLILRSWIPSRTRKANSKLYQTRRKHALHM